MKIVIEVPKEEYNTRQLVHYFGCYSDKLDMVIYTGTPLPEHHGDLKDEREVASILLKYAHSEEGRRFANFLISEIKSASTIIEGSESE